MTSQNRKRGVLINEMRAQGIRRLKLLPEHLWRRMDYGGLGYVRKFDVGRTIVRVADDAGDREFLQMTNCSECKGPHAPENCPKNTPASYECPSCGNDCSGECHTNNHGRDRY